MRPRRRRTGSSDRWREYERRKADFARRKPAAPPQEFDLFIRQLAKKLGL